DDVPPRMVGPAVRRRTLGAGDDRTRRGRTRPVRARTPLPDRLVGRGGRRRPGGGRVHAVRLRPGRLPPAGEVHPRDPSPPGDTRGAPGPLLDRRRHVVLLTPRPPLGRGRRAAGVTASSRRLPAAAPRPAGAPPP